MIFSNFNFFDYSNDFKNPYKVYNEVIAKRDGLLFYIDINGITAEGEYSFLPELHNTTIDQAKKYLTHFIEQLKSSPENYLIEDFSKIPLDYPPEINFSIYTLIFDYFRKLNKTKEYKTESNILMTDIDIDQVKENKIIKLKIGRSNTSSEIGLINKLTNRNIRLRLDSNRNLSIDDFKIFLENIDLSKIDYFEEPILDLTELNQIEDKYSFNIALDENLLNTELYNLKSLKALVIKPSLIKDFKEFTRLIDLAKNKNLKISISSTFENHSGKIFQNHLANLVDNSIGKQVHGLDTLALFL